MKLPTKKLNEAIQQYIELFCEKQEIKFYGWVNDDSGTVGDFGSWFIYFSDIRLDLETDQPKHEIFKWYKHNQNTIGKKIAINYDSWIKGYTA